MSLLSRLLSKCYPLSLACRVAVSKHTARNMRLVQFTGAGSCKQCIGVKEDEHTIVNLSDFSPELPTDICTALSTDQGKLLSAASSCLQSSQKRIPIGDVELLPPITRPDKVVCIGLNYRDHCKEVGKEPPIEPVVFSKFSSCISKSGEMAIPPVTQCLDWECELVVVVGKKAKDVKEADAMDYVFGYTAANDVSARDLVSGTKNGGQFLLAKALDNFCPISSDIVTKDEIPDVHNLKISTAVNGTVRQSSNTNQIIFKVPQLIAYISGLFTLLPGDIILTGTPGGVGAGMKPPTYLKSGDEVKVEIEGVGVVTNKFV